MATGVDVDVCVCVPVVVGVVVLVGVCGRKHEAYVALLHLASCTTPLTQQVQHSVPGAASHTAQSNHGGGVAVLVAVRGVTEELGVVEGLAVAL